MIGKCSQCGAIVCVSCGEACSQCGGALHGQESITGFSPSSIEKIRRNKHFLFCVEKEGGV